MAEGVKREGELLDTSQSNGWRKQDEEFKNQYWQSGCLFSGETDANSNLTIESSQEIFKLNSSQESSRTQRV